MRHSEKIALVDVGGAGGLQDKWKQVADKILPVLFEPNQDEASKILNAASADFGDVVLLNKALGSSTGTRTLNIAAWWGCSSILKQNDEVLSNYRIAPAFQQIRPVEIHCVRYDELFRNDEAPQPDVIKVDVQGYELEVLRGFGDLLHGCIAIELEAHLYPIYKNQPLLGDLVAFLKDYGFVLRKISPTASFDGDIVEVDVVFTQNRQSWKRFDQEKKLKFDTINQVLDLVSYNRIDDEKDHWVIDP